MNLMIIQGEVTLTEKGDNRDRYRKLIRAVREAEEDKMYHDFVEHLLECYEKRKESKIGKENAENRPFEGETRVPSDTQCKYRRDYHPTEADRDEQAGKEVQE